MLIQWHVHSCVTWALADFVLYTSIFVKVALAISYNVKTNAVNFYID